mmetsp:Transcript_1363/g.3392  ORF Transcript_1363/g.3392 Transcript_1363/m.3392 type:complete len:240 (-) Transcript_1363:1289-2008(-)
MRVDAIRAADCEANNTATRDRSPAEAGAGAVEVRGEASLVGEQRRAAALRTEPQSLLEVLGHRQSVLARRRRKGGGGRRGACPKGCPCHLLHRSMLVIILDLLEHGTVVRLGERLLLVGGHIEVHRTVLLTGQIPVAEREHVPASSDETAAVHSLLLLEERDRFVKQLLGLGIFASPRLELPGGLVVYGRVAILRQILADPARDELGGLEVLLELRPVDVGRVLEMRVHQGVVDLQQRD